MNDMNDPYESQYREMAERKTAAPKMALAMAYVPEQAWETPYDPMDGLDRGTMFPSLDKPFLGGGNRW